MKHNYVGRSTKKKSAVALTFKIIATLLVVGAFTFCLVWTITNWDTVKNAVTNGSNIATEEDVNNAYKDGYNEGVKDKDNYTALVNDYKSKYEAELEKKTQLEKSNLELQSTLNVLTTQKTELETQVNNLTTIKTNNESTIADLNIQITSLKYQVNSLTTSNENKAEQIEQLNTQIANLQNTVSQLQTTNDMNLQTITSLNTQIANLNTQISDMTMQSQNSSSQINALNNRINELQESINYYESYIASLETSEQVVATFEFDGSVYNIQIVNKGAKVSVVDPTSTDYVIFNYWTVDDEKIDLNTYTFNTNTKIVANVTYKYDVKFMVDNTNYDSQIITKDGYATIPSNPSKDGYEFDGWSLNGVDVVSNIDTNAVTQNITYTAKFTKLHTVTFVVDGTTVDTQYVRNGEFATLPENPTKDNYEIEGWTLNESSIINISEINILADTIFTAKFTQLFTISFASEQSVYPQIIYSYQIREGEFATDTGFEKPSKEYYEFDGWTIRNGYIFTNVTLDSYEITGNTTFYPAFNKVQSTVKIYDGNQLIHSGVYNVGDTLVLSDITPLGREGCYFTGYYGLKDGSSYGTSSHDAVITDLSQQSTKKISTYNSTLYAFYSEYCTGQFVSTSKDGNSFTLGYDVSLGGGSNTSTVKVKNEISLGVFKQFISKQYLDITTGTFYLKEETSYTVDGVQYTGYKEYSGIYDRSTDSWTFTRTDVKGDVKTVTYTETFVRSAYVYGYPVGNITE